jgi:hypothetical protein
VRNYAKEYSVFAKYDDNLIADVGNEAKGDPPKDFWNLNGTAVDHKA